MYDSILVELLRYLGWALDGIGLPPASAGDLLGLSTTDLATLISGFGGAILGGLIGAAASYLTAQQAAKEARQRDADARDDLEQSAAFRMMIKASQLAGSVETITRHIMRGVERDHVGQMPVERLWTYVQPTSLASGAPVEFDASDFVFLLKGRNGELIQRALMLATGVRALEAAFADYVKLRINMQSLLEDHTRVVAARGQTVTDVPDDLSNKTHLRSLEMDNLLKQILEASHELAIDASAVCRDLNAAANAIFGSRFSLRVGLQPEGA